MALVGRGAELAVATELLDRAAAGRGAALLLSGESGIGKSELALDVLRTAEASGFHTLTARAQPLDRDLAYTVVIEAFGRHLRAVPPERLGRLVTGVPALSHLFPGLGLPAPEPLSDSVLERTRLFESVLRLLERIALTAPVALLVDDLHWADAASLELIAYLVRDLPHLPVLVVVTYRHTSRGVAGVRQASLDGLLRSLRRSGSVREVPLGRLPRSDVESMIATRLDGRPMARLLDVVAKRAGGVPLFVEAYVGWLRDTGRLSRDRGEWNLVGDVADEVPPAVRDLLVGDLASLTDTERGGVELVAVGGGHAEPDLLSHVARREEPRIDVMSGLARLVRTGRLVEELHDQNVRYAFPHPLLHEVAYQEIPVARRRRLHRAFAEVLESRDDLLGQAMHCLAAGSELSPERVVGVLSAAGDLALDRYATEDALTFYDAALERLGRAEGPEDHTSQVRDLLVGLGEAQRRSGRLSDAAATWRSSLEWAKGADDTLWRARLYRMIADVESDRGDVAAADRDAEAGLAALATCPPCEEHIELLWVMLVSRGRVADRAAGLRLLARLEDVAGRVGSPRGRLLVSQARIAAHLEAGHYMAARAELAATAEMPEAATDPRFRARRWQCVALVAASLGELTALREANREIAKRERDIGVPGWTYRGPVLRFVEAFLSGDWDRAAEAFEGLGDADRADNPRVAATGTLIATVLAAYRAEFTAADRLLGEGRSRLEAGHMPQPAGREMLGMVGALVALERQDALTARDLLEANDGSFGMGVLPPWGLAALAESRARTGGTEVARVAVADLAGLGPPGSYPEVLAQRAEGLVLAAEGDPARARRTLLGARTGFTRLGMPFESARAVVDAAEVERDSTSTRGASARATAVSAEDAAGPTSDRDLVADLTTAYRTMTTLGAARHAGRAARQLRARGVRPPRFAVSSVDLTPRQREIAELVTEGLANAEIAERLCVSVRTVTSHLDHIYTRLGISSRAALAGHIARNRSPSPSPSRLRIPADAAPGTPDAP